jgi:hypothetical protein
VKLLLAQIQAVQSIGADGPVAARNISDPPPIQQAYNAAEEMHSGTADQGISLVYPQDPRTVRQLSFTAQYRPDKVRHVLRKVLPIGVNANYNVGAPIDSYLVSSSERRSTAEIDAVNGHGCTVISGDDLSIVTGAIDADERAYSVSIDVGGNPLKNLPDILRFVVGWDHHTYGPQHYRSKLLIEPLSRLGLHKANEVAIHQVGDPRVTQEQDVQE